MLRFAAWYLLSLVLLGVVAIAFWRNLSATWQANQDTKFETEASYVQADVELYGRLADLERAYGQYFGQKTEATKAALTTAKNSFSAALDNLRKQAQLQSDAATRKGLDELAGRYDNSFKLKTALFNTWEQTANKDTTTATAGPASSSGADVQSLRAQLAEKDRIIASLQTGGASPAGADEELKKRYAALKAAYDKSAAAEQQAKAAYQTIIKDNQRLLQQIQTLRKG